MGIWPGYFGQVADDKQAEFSLVIKEAQAKIAKSYEDALDDKQTPPALGIFMLKNCGYTDRVEVNANITADDNLADLAKAARGLKPKQAK